MIETIALVLLIVNALAFAVLWSRDQNLLYAVMSMSLLILFGMTVVREFTPEWRDYQKRFIQLQIEKATDPEIIDSLKSTPIKILQIWNKELDVADRCTTCHLAVDNPDFKDAEEPFRYHAAAREHEFGKIGCTICHQGQGRGTDEVNAHARGIMHWEHPMWESDMVQASCPQCHERIYEPGYSLKGAERLMEARDIIGGKNEMEMECIECHTIRGVGETLAPDLSAYGATTEHEFELTHDLTHVEGEKNKFNWTYQHFIDPLKISPGNEETGVEPTIMPNFELTEGQAHNLTLFVYSLKDSLIPAKYQYREFQPEGKTEPSFIKEFEESFESLESLPEGQQLFIKSKCWFCHTINGQGGKVGPNLTKVGARRDKASILKHFETVEQKKEHPMANRFHFSDEELDALSEYLASLK